MSEPKVDCRDTAFFVAPGLAVVHDENHDTSIGRCAPMVDGQPIPPGALLIEQEEGTPHGRVIYRPPPADAHDGPSRVATPAYRNGWDRTFGKEAN